MRVRKARATNFGVYYGKTYDVIIFNFHIAIWPILHADKVAVTNYFFGVPCTFWMHERMAWYFILYFLYRKPMAQSKESLLIYFGRGILSGSHWSFLSNGTYDVCRSWSTTIVCWCTQKSRIQKVLPHLFHKLLNDCNRGTTTVTSTCNRYTTTIKCIHVHVAGLCCLWFCRNACSLIYYGLLFYLPTLGGNVYLGLVLSGLVEVRWRTCRFPQKPKCDIFAIFFGDIRNIGEI